MTIAVVIPVFNEETEIEGCLQAIAGQTVMPDEVIVVDNNSTDNTVALSQKFSFVRVVKESKQGRGHARNAGFNAAKSDILGRIDADSRIASDWVERVKKRFEQDAELSGLTGIGLTSFMPKLHNPKTTLFSRGYYWYVHAGFRTITMWGANMAIRRDSWLGIADKVCLDDLAVHEDQDVSLWIAGAGGRIEQDNQMIIVADGQAYISIKKALHYRRLFFSTRKRHAENGNLAKARKFRSNPVEKILGFLVVYVAGGLVLALSVIGAALSWPVRFLHSKKRAS